ncbi:MAG: hypothetical protein PHI79_05670 [Sulfurovaceae bacterium]|nr:hypothetical protein [Sulfurovaceae bacterium]MDD5549065.1 hypothetical protein [Sulfurovaceae bacterium]
MKKLVKVVAFMAISSLITTNGGLLPKLYANSAMDQLQDADDTGQDAVDQANFGDLEGAHGTAGSAFDGNDVNNPPPVDLTGKEGVVDPNDLKKHNPPSDGEPIE